MEQPTTNPGNRLDGPKVYVGAHIPLSLYQSLVQEAQQAMVTRSDVLRWALAERYRRPAEEREQSQ
ncbi:MAG TPA: hypothetical protein VLC52_11830 [Anaerolineae bacterium]|nr:hypothetical protein [Anaerolineae bacterium]